MTDGASALVLESDARFTPGVGPDLNYILEKLEEVVWECPTVVLLDSVKATQCQDVMTFILINGMARTSSFHDTHAYWLNAEAAHVLLDYLPKVAGHVTCDVSTFAQRFPEVIQLRECPYPLFQRRNIAYIDPKHWMWTKTFFQLLGIPMNACHRYCTFQQCF